MVGLYSSLGEMIIVNLPLAIGFGSIALIQPFIFAIWLGFLAWHIANNHSCHWILPKWIDNPAFHFLHHQFHTINFGATWVKKIL